MGLFQNSEALRYAAPLGEFGRAGAVNSPPVEKPEIPSSKRAFDIGLVLLFLPVFLPVMAVIYGTLFLTGGRPVFVQRRVGQSGRMFSCYKFRTMVRDANLVLTKHLDANPDARAEWDRNFKLQNDPRITPFGAFLRRSSLDELPQLFNILKGDMSLVGPRPIVPSEIDYYKDRIADYWRCRPGLTGLWQVSGRNLLSYEKRVRLDSFYARKQSLQLDLAILFQTVWVVLSGRGAC